MPSTFGVDTNPCSVDGWCVECEAGAATMDLQDARTARALQAKQDWAAIQWAQSHA